MFQYFLSASPLEIYTSIKRRCRDEGVAVRVQTYKQQHEIFPSGE